VKFHDNQIVNIKVFSFSPFSRIFSIAWEFLFNLGIFRNKILGFLKIQSGIAVCQWVTLTFDLAFRSAIR